MSLIALGSAIVAACLVKSTATLSSTLLADGYKAVHLRPTIAGHLQTSGVLQGQPVEVIIDTGASNTVVDIEFARKLGLQLVPVEQRGAGVGKASVSVKRVTNPILSVGGIPILGDVFTMDLSAATAALRARGGPSFQVVVGGDTMRKLEAILIYRENTLFLRSKND